MGWLVIQATAFSTVERYEDDAIVFLPLLNV